MIRVALALGIVLEAIEILRRAPAWLLLLAGALSAWLLLLVAAHLWWVAAGLAVLLLVRLGRRIARERR